MPSIKKSCIESIRQRVSLAEVASSLVRLKRSGALLRGLSPFNHEKTPSFFVNPEKNLFTCYSSGKSGDLFEFVMQTENLTFPEAVETVARRFGIEVEYEDDGKALQSISLNSKLIKLHESAASLFQQAFAADNEEAAAIRKYWTQQRGFTLEQAREFGIGYAPAQPHAILEALRNEGHSHDIWRESGLFFSRPGETNLKHFGLRFAGRLMIPIRDIQSRVIGFSGRVTERTPDGPSKDAKYVNSPETPIFKKSDILFGLHHARLHLKEGQSLLVVEGQLDAMRCWACGIHATVAPQGTAITEQQMALARRYTERIEFLLDGDRAGVDAALRALPIAWKAGLEPSFLRLKEGEDPDSLLLAEGAKALESLRARATGAVPFLYQSLLPNGSRSDRSEKRHFLQEFFSYVSNIESQVLQQDVMAELARLLGITTELLLQDYAKQQKKSRVQVSTPSSQSSKVTRTRSLSASLELDILTFLLHHLNYGQALAQFIEHEWIDTGTVEGQLLDRLLIEFLEGEPVTESSLDSLLYTDEERALVNETRCHPLQIEHPLTLANHNIAKLYQRHLKSRIDELDQNIHNSGNKQDIQLVNELQRQRQSLVKQMRTPPQIPDNLLN